MAGFPQEQTNTPTAQTLLQDSQHATSKSVGPAAKSIQYVNAKYGFTFSLPTTRKGYEIVEDTWEGGNNKDPHGYEVVERGPEIRIVNPQ